jgi:hypothetical protein
MYTTYPFGLDVNSFQIMQIDHLKRTDTTWTGKQIPTNPQRKPPFESSMKQNPTTLVYRNKSIRKWEEDPKRWGRTKLTTICFLQEP